MRFQLSLLLPQAGPEQGVLERGDDFSRAITSRRGCRSHLSLPEMLFPSHLSQSSWPAQPGTWQSVGAVSAEHSGTLHSTLTTVLLLLPPPPQPAANFFRAPFSPALWTGCSICLPGRGRVNFAPATVWAPHSALCQSPTELLVLFTLTWHIQSRSCWKSQIFLSCLVLCFPERCENTFSLHCAGEKPSLRAGGVVCAG